ncbi:MAG: bifunctional diaminohydroxyphosphoribosylaminopyrimidine deaminase/5-amino-6-(5-phosphoribosylamino)uracil reductase RibD [Paludibacter sp.]|nr:bifunctional diaminohydroxyphosphoribosylaminopyrimidine deaminase/5-amino-6-(5-phosphoribosylamino)uracil reductase RibD [Bacteroidales bacterium]MCM1068653.1 bifunctional diaminohydroxyphosphoribosylaminopyrimidine deaminase/5-amino-6-(5-phosphoribosylamino)uracil reductase RibD [Prevotella sp.]MCM1353317.1 bifunctional diaminohydroxyphosphoribosylaminopyrimidine deaminase/5-amino-6-(5-phosphoribosylamino)uracil reductase RibD [Bacteroides sp.]MCM1442275.1 bifunctional diaminohydroxyphospho
MSDCEIYMHRCLQLAKLGEYHVAPNPMVGAVIVSGNRTIAEGWHRRFGGPHAEVEAFRNVPEGTDLSNATLYVSLEPCSHYGKTPPCAELILRKKVKRVVVGCLDPNPQVAGKGIRMLQESGIEVQTGVLENECRELNKRFLCLHERHRPYVILKWAQTQDGIIGFSSEQLTKRGERLRISNSVSKQIVHKMRAENMSIMIGTNTALQDNPRLLTTHWSGRNPIRIVVDQHNRIPATSNIFSTDAETIVYRNNTEWEYILQDLASRNIHSILVEGGATLLNHILRTDIYDEIHVETASFCAGTGISAPLLHLSSTPPINIEGNLLYTLHKNASCND